MNDLDRKILEIIKAHPGQKAKDISERLGIDRSEVNSSLSGRLKTMVMQDRNYRWYPKNHSASLAAAGAATALDTPLAHLCRYYLDCLSHEDLGGVSEFAESRYDDLKYVELNSLPFDNQDSDIFKSESVQRLMSRIRRDRNRQTLFLGYPVRLNLIRSKKGWEGFMVEPIFLFPFQDSESRYDAPSLSEDLPQFNFKALRSLSNSSETLMEEAIQLAEELGLANAADDQPDLDELLIRLREIRADWDWQEPINLSELSRGVPLSNLKTPGIYNRAILIAAERSPYTKGLESELGTLQSTEEGKYLNSSLGTWLSSKTLESNTPDEKPLIEVLPLNSEQRQAVRQAMSNQLTVITGPPGTGKSQVVTSILINAAWQGKTVLFASKNHKAVNVVETRINALGPRPVLLRLGSNRIQNRLAEYLITLLAATTAPEDHEHYQEHQAIHNQLKQRSDALDTELQNLIDLRNTVDRLEQQVECIRQIVGEDVFQQFRSICIADLSHYVDNMKNTIHRANILAQPFFTQLFWFLVAKKRFSQLKDFGDTFKQTSQNIGLPIPENDPETESIHEWIEYGQDIENRMSQIKQVQEYFSQLDSLTNSRPIGELSSLRKELNRLLSSNSEQLWSAWLRLQPSRITPQQRRLLGDYIALLQLIVNANEQEQSIGRDVFRQYYKMFPQLTSILGCWAVTSLSARSKVPFTENFFDLLVIDEASQCDIASALPLLYRARRVVIIGDPMQLRHISTISRQQDQQLLGKHGLLNTYPGWAYSARSLFDLASSLCRSEDIVNLRDHHRSHADIIEFSNKTFYEGRLRVATNYDRLRCPGNDHPAIRWVDVQGRAIRPGNGGAINETEAKAIVGEIERLCHQGYRGTIGVVSPFRAQVNRICDLFFNHQKLVSSIASIDFLCDTAHGFQGDERDIIIFSPVVSAGISSGAVGFLRNTPNLFNVAITRARAALIVVGDRRAALDCEVSYLSQFIAYIETLNKRQFQHLVEPDINLGPHYPAVANPELVSEWEHVFYGALYQTGIQPIPQYPVEKYLLDFAIIYRNRRLNIEIDGERYHRNWDGELCRRDQIRNQRLMELGWDVMRFWVYQVRDDLDNCINRVRQWQENVKSKGNAKF